MASQKSNNDRQRLSNILNFIKELDLPEDIEVQIEELNVEHLLKDIAPMFNHEASNLIEALGISPSMVFYIVNKYGGPQITKKSKLFAQAFYDKELSTIEKMFVAFEVGTAVPKTTEVHIDEAFEKLLKSIRGLEEGLE